MIDRCTSYLFHLPLSRFRTPAHRFLHLHEHCFSQALPPTYPSCCCVLYSSVDLPCRLISRCVSAFTHSLYTVHLLFPVAFSFVSDINRDHMKRVRTRRCLCWCTAQTVGVYSLIVNTPGCNWGMEERPGMPSLLSLAKPPFSRCRWIVCFV